jgi:hypothetical protein
MSHTPGPWTNHGPSERKEEFYGTYIQVGPAILFVDEFYDRGDPAHAAADARLIEEAPTMKALLREIAHRGFERSWHDHLDDDIRALLARIDSAVDER